MGFNKVRSISVVSILFFIVTTIVVLIEVEIGQLKYNRFNVKKNINIPASQQEMERNVSKSLTKQKIRLHIYNKPMGYSLKYMFKGCENKCYATAGINISTSKYVIFFAPHLDNHVPEKMPGQVWIFFGHESPKLHRLSNFGLWKNKFNWTVTYRRDSDVFREYGLFSNAPKAKRMNNSTTKVSYDNKNPKFSANKIKAFWIVSNCKPFSKRKEYAELMTQFPNFTLDIYGKCGTLRCPKTITCLRDLSKKYPFYLSFENALCVDYITEKSFKLYQHYIDSVPIVRGDHYSYHHFLPPGSYINVNDFKYIESLIGYLKLVVRDENLFKKYFEWRKNFESPIVSNHCKLCNYIYMNNKYNRRSMYDNIDVWLRGNRKKPMCRTPNDLKNIRWDIQI